VNISRCHYCTDRHAGAQLLETLHYKPESLGSTPNKNEYQEYFLGRKSGRCLGLTTLPPLCADCFQIWEPHPPGTFRSCTAL